MNRTTPQKNQVYEISVWAHIEILNSFLAGGVPLRIQGMYWDITPGRILQ